jgi:hypothetical protein
MRWLGQLFEFESIPAQRNVVRPLLLLLRVRPHFWMRGDRLKEQENLTRSSTALGAEGRFESEAPH